MATNKTSSIKKSVKKNVKKKTRNKLSVKKSKKNTNADKLRVKSSTSKTAMKPASKKVNAKIPATKKNSTNTTASHRAGGISGSTFLFTGTLKSMQRKDAEAMVKDNGGTILSGVSDKLNYLVVGEDAGSKLTKAKALKTVKIISEKEFIALSNSTDFKGKSNNENSKRTNISIPKETIIIIDFEVMDEDDIEGDPDQFWEDMEEDHAFIETNMLDQLPVIVTSKGKLKILGDYMMRYICTAEVSAKELAEKYSDQLIAFCKNPDAYYYGTISMKIGQLTKKQDEKKLLKDEDAFYSENLSDKYWVTEFGVEES